MIRPAPHIADMAPYALSRMQVSNRQTLVSLSQNESLRRPSPMAIEAATRALWDGALYPDPDWCELRTALSRLHGLNADSILCGAGSLDLIAAIARVYAGPNRAVLAPRHAYPFFRTAAQMAGARYDSAPEQGVVVDVDALLRSLKPDTAVVFVANPGNPTGTRIPVGDLRGLRAKLPENILLVVDEAYGEFSDHLDQRCFDMVEGGATIVLRTFSKAYGLAGIRVGWGVFPPPIACELRKVLNPNNISGAGQAAALGALMDQDYMIETCAMTAEMRDLATELLSCPGLQVVPSHTNFLLLQLGSADVAHRVNAVLNGDGIFLRPQTGAGLPSVLRMTLAAREILEPAADRIKQRILEETQ